MNFNQIEWECTGQLPEELTGRSTGIHSYIQFTITAIDYENGTYRIKANNSNIPEQESVGLENAKHDAQLLLNSYALMQAIL